MSGLRQLASLGEEQLRFDGSAVNASIGLDAAVALALFLAVLLPPFLDDAIATAGAVAVTVTAVANLVTLSVRGTPSAKLGFDVPRGRLMRAYATQLNAKGLVELADGTRQLRFVIERPAGSLAQT